VNERPFHESPKVAATTSAGTTSQTEVSRSAVSAATEIATK